MTLLSVGGFMATSAETILNSAHNARPGDIMCVGCPPQTMTHHLTVYSVSPVDIVAASSSGSSSTAGMQFVREMDLTEEEKLYGKRLSCDMLRELFEVGRVDSATNSLEAIFLDGTRQKLKVFAVRLAGVCGEEELFR
ncbi:Trypanosoma vivax [Trypanosoma theileri]|uniref:Trypanosoma vivax n=1 Tax=Trypanosoma theileri TaxID=67003 RepID=A0A1X0NHW0_9TRYP|nr:Trypanosoma vivax [Trypanosoma theileri]ORC83670.1 Trypanosoma vivax [Trypanosoma theileri]